MTSLNKFEKNIINEFGRHQEKLLFKKVKKSRSNLIINGDFEHGNPNQVHPGWVPDPGFTKVNNKGSFNNIVESYYVINVIPGGTYAVSLEAENIINIKFKIIEYNGDTFLRNAINFDLDGNHALYSEIVLSLSTDKIRYSFSGNDPINSGVVDNVCVLAI